MSLSSTSNTINALGVFGIIKPEQEEYFHSLEAKYSQKPKNGDTNGFFNHLSIVINRDVPVGKLSSYIDLLRELKQFLPSNVEVSDVTAIDGSHLALSFDIQQTQALRELASKFIGEGVVTTHYIKVVWFVPKEKQEEAIKDLKTVNKITFYDFILAANIQNDENTIYSSNRYK